MPFDWIKDVYDIGKDVYNEFTKGQARDEARQVRQSDIARDDYWQERGSIRGRIQEGMSMGLSRAAAAGVQPSSGMASVVGQDTGYTNMASAGQNYHPLNKLNRELLNAQIESVKLDNLKKFNSLQTPTTGGTGSGFVPGSKMSKKINDNPMDRTTSVTGYSEPGAITSIGYSTNPDGSFTLVPSKDVKERIEDDLVLESNWKLQAISNAKDMADHLPKPAAGKYWAFNPATLTFSQKDRHWGLGLGKWLNSKMPWNQYRPSTKGVYTPPQYDVTYPYKGISGKRQPVRRTRSHGKYERR